MNKPEWLLNDKDDKELYELLTLEDVFADQKIIAEFAQKKLLKYLKTQKIHGRTFNEMLKQLDEQ